MAIKIARRKFIVALGGTAFAWPLAAHSQHVAMPVIGFVNGFSPETWAPNVTAFRQGLSEVGYDEGRNVAIEYRWAQNQSERLPGMVAELVGRPVTVIVAKRRRPGCAGSQGRDSDDSDRRHDCLRSGRERSRGQLEPAGRQHYRREHVFHRARREARAASARNRSQRLGSRLSRKSERPECESRREKWEAHCRIPIGSSAFTPLGF
jgi:hypothetical protein